MGYDVQQTPACRLRFKLKRFLLMAVVLLWFQLAGFTQTIAVSFESGQIKKECAFMVRLEINNPDNKVMKNHRVFWKKATQTEYKEIDTNYYHVHREGVRFHLPIKLDSTWEQTYDVLLKYVDEEGGLRSLRTRKTQKIKEFDKGTLLFENLSDHNDTLYLNCLNNMRVSNPVMGESFWPYYYCEGGWRIMGIDRGTVRLIPDSSTIIVSVYNRGIFIGKKMFEVKEIPLPEIKLMSGNKEIDLKKGTPLIPSIDLKIIADEKFKESYPSDARYKIQDGFVSLMDGDRVVAKIKITSSFTDVSVLNAQARRGNTYHVEIGTVYRKNYNNNKEVVERLCGLEYDIPIN